jgi:hypothetical protein
MSKKTVTPQQARQVVEAHYLEMDPKPIPWDPDLLTATVKYIMDEGHSGPAVMKALKYCKAYTMAAIGFHLRQNAQAAHQPSEQRNKHPKMFVPEEPVERSEVDVAIARAAFAEMRATLRESKPVRLDEEQTYPSPPPPPTPVSPGGTQLQ